MMKTNNNRAEEALLQIKAQDAIILEGAISVLAALSAKEPRILKIIMKKGANSHGTPKILLDARAKNIETVIFSPEEMAEFEKSINSTGFFSLGGSHGGILAIAKKRTFLSPEELILALPKNQKYLSIAIIEGIEDPYNLGYAARALYTQGTDALVLPKRDFGFSEATIEKASTGTFSKLPIAVFSSNKRELLELLKGEGFRIYCMDKKAPAGSSLKASDIFEVKFFERSVFVIGGELRGISRDFLLGADEIVTIPYAKPYAYSLAAQSAATIVSYEIHRQRRENARSTGSNGSKI